MAITRTGVFLLLLLVVAISTAAAQTAPSPQRLDCTNELGRISPCIPYIAAPPLNFMASPDTECCSVFSSIMDYGTGVCICYLIKEPILFDFLLDGSRVLSLSQICTKRESICSPSELAKLPPFENPQITVPSDSAPPTGTDRLMTTNPGRERRSDKLQVAAGLAARRSPQ